VYPSGAAMKPVDSKQKEVSLTELIIASNQAEDTGRPPQQAVLMAVAEMSMPFNEHMRFGNTLFIINKGQGRNGYMSAMNIDTPRNFIENVKKFIDSAYLLGFDNLVTVFKQPQLIQIFRIIAKNPPRPELGYELKTNKYGAYVANFKLGPSREGGLQ
jgi:hypothetical protein